MDKIDFVFFKEDHFLRSGWRLLILILSLIFTLIFFNFILNIVGLAEPVVDEVIKPYPFLINSLVTFAGAILCVWLLMRFLENRPLSTVGLPLNGPWVTGTLSGLLLGGAPVVVIVFIINIFGDLEIRFTSIGPADILSHTIPITLTLFFLSFFEEFILRGYTLQLLTEGAGRWFAAIVTGILFGVAHADNPGANFLGMVNTAAIGILLAWLVMRTGSLWIAGGYHAGWNITGAIIFGMRLSGIDVEGSFFSTTITGPDWLTGGEYGFEGSAVAGVSELIILTLTVLIAPKLPGYPEIRELYTNRFKKRN